MDVPVLHLALVGVPLAATAAGWLVAGREPPAIARPVLDRSRARHEHSTSLSPTRS